MKKYIIRKTVTANSIEQALRKERTTKPDEVRLDDEQPPTRGSTDAYGFHYEAEDP